MFIRHGNVILNSKKINSIVEIKGEVVVEFENETRLTLILEKDEMRMFFAQIFTQLTLSKRMK